MSLRIHKHPSPIKLQALSCQEGLVQRDATTRLDRIDLQIRDLIDIICVWRERVQASKHLVSFGGLLSSDSFLVRFGFSEKKDNI